MAVVPLTASTPARAQQNTAVCSFAFTDGSISPGVTASSSTAADWRAGPVTLLCIGTVDGQPITGPAVISEYGTLEGTCAEGKGMGWQHASLPTPQGTVRIENPAPFWWKAGAGALEGPRMRGTFVFWPTAGNCFTEPVTRYGQVTQLILTSS